MKKSFAVLTLFLFGFVFSCREGVSDVYRNSGTCEKLTDIDEMEEKVYDKKHDTVVLYTRVGNQACEEAMKDIVDAVVKVNPTVEFYEIDVDSDFYKNQQTSSSIIAKSDKVADADLPVVVFYSLGVKTEEHRGAITMAELNEFVENSKTPSGGNKSVPDWLVGTWYEAGAKRIEIGSNSINYIGYKDKKFQLLNLEDVSTKLAGNVYEVSNRWNTYKFTKISSTEIELDIHQFFLKRSTPYDMESTPYGNEWLSWHDTQMFLLNAPPVSGDSSLLNGPGIPANFGTVMPDWMDGIWYDGNGQPKLYVSDTSLYYDGEQYLSRPGISGVEKNGMWGLKLGGGKYMAFSKGEGSIFVYPDIDSTFILDFGGEFAELYHEPRVGDSADGYLHPVTVGKHVKFMFPTYIMNPKDHLGEKFYVPADYKYEPMITRIGDAAGDIADYTDTMNDKTYVSDWSDVELDDYGYFKDVWSYPDTSMYLYYEPVTMNSATCLGSIEFPRKEGLYAEHDWTRLLGIDSNPQQGYDIRFAYWTDDPVSCRKFNALGSAWDAGKDRDEGAAPPQDLSSEVYFHRDVTLYAVFESVPWREGYDPID